VEQPLTYLKQRAGEDWLIGYDTNQFNYLTEQLFQQLSKHGTPLKILLAEQNPWQFLAAFLAAVAADCPVFLCNPNWVEQEWQQVFDLVQPDLIWGDLSGVSDLQKLNVENSIGLRPLPPQPSTLHEQKIMIPTGGSSGKIRFAIHTWETLMASVRGFHQYFGEKPINSFCVLPLYHVSGLMQFLRSFTTGGQLVILPFKALVAGEGRHIDPTKFFISLVPTQLARLISLEEELKVERSNFQPQDLGIIETIAGISACVDPPQPNATRLTSPPAPLLQGEGSNTPPFPSREGGQGGLGQPYPNSIVPQPPFLKGDYVSPITWLSGFHTVLLGGAPAWAALLEQARHYNIPLALTYGMTETASQVVTLKPEAFRRGNNNCGQVLPHAQVSIRSPTGEILEANQIGIITIKADSLALGYYPEPFTNPQYFQPDDLGFFDDQGYLNVVGRNSNKIITGGENVFPAEVEAAILATQLVTDVCVTGIPDSQWGQAVIAIYVSRTQAVSTALLETALEDKLSKYKRPKYWVSVEGLPRNSQGKVNYEQLQEIVTVRLESQKASSSLLG
jgi:O-succinylbenzoic acid--CoA ligase